MIHHLSNFVLFFTCLPLSFNALSEANTLVTVQTRNGFITGLSKQNAKGSNFYSFTGIPYAEKPIGSLRFKAPQPAKPWHGTLNATHDAPVCFQQNIFDPLLKGQDDCLYLNVFTPKVPGYNFNGSLMPVMFFIHGGSYVINSGNTDWFGAENLMMEDIVLVTINYRLGLLGFLSFDDRQFGIPGNAAMKDQIMALKWVRDNIKNFGGDPEAITLFGQSAGSASIHLHMLSPLSKGMFKGAIMQSGCALNPFSNGGRRSGEILTELLKINNLSRTEILDYLQKMPLDNFIDYQNKVSAELSKDGYYLAPIVETYLDEATFLSDEPAKLMTKPGQFYSVPTIMGYTSREAVIDEVVRTLSQKPVGKVAVKDLVPQNIKETSNEQRVLLDIKKFYFNNEDYTLDNSTEYLTYQSDVEYVWDIYKTLKMFLELSDKPIYFYRFSADTKLNVMKHLTKTTTNISGAIHADDMGYLFKTKHTPKIEPGSSEMKSVEDLVKLWSNFAKFGNPTPRGSFIQWTCVENEKCPEYLNIGNQIVPGSRLPELERATFGENLFKDVETT